jgi:DNA-binding transcriptional regulator YiaG
VSAGAYAELLERRAQLDGASVSVVDTRSKHAPNARPMCQDTRMSETSDLIELSRYIRTGRARSIRESAGIAAESIAADLGVSAATVRRWETGDVTPARTHALGWLKLLRAIDASLREVQGNG